MAEQWGMLFDRAAEREATLAGIRAALAERRGGDGPDQRTEDRGTDGEGPGTAPDHERPDPARVVADADVLAADLLVGGDAREALDHLRRHSWVELVASDPLLDDARAVVGSLADADLAGDWHERVAERRVRVTHPAGDHPGVASAYRGAAGHLLSLDGNLHTAGAGVWLRARTPTSVKQPRAFAGLFDPESLHREVVGGTYPGPDRDPRG